MSEEIKIHFKDFEAIRVNDHTPEEWHASPELEQKVEEKWQQVLEKAPNTWNGPMLRLERGACLAGPTLYIDTSLTDFKHHQGTRYNLDPEERANPIFVSAMMITKDNQLVFGMRKNCDSNNDMYNIAAGSVHPVLDAPDGIPSLGVALYREVFDEFGIISDAFQSVRPLMVFGRQKEPTYSFLYEVRLEITAEDVKRKTDAAVQRALDMGMKPEMTYAYFVDNSKEALRQDLDSHPRSYTPMVTALLEHMAK